jgi:hypothetical protein
MTDTKVYTYIYQRRDGTPYYVGKGTGMRYWSEKRNVARPESKARVVLQYWSSETEALSMEAFYIRLFGRKNNATGILDNLTDGGAGRSGTSEERSAGLQAQRAYQAAPHTKPHSQRTRRKIAATQRRAWAAGVYKNRKQVLPTVEQCSKGGLKGSTSRWGRA